MGVCLKSGLPAPTNSKQHLSNSVGFSAIIGTSDECPRSRSSEDYTLALNVAEFVLGEVPHAVMAHCFWFRMVIQKADPDNHVGRWAFGSCTRTKCFALLKADPLSFGRKAEQKGSCRPVFLSCSACPRPITCWLVCSNVYPNDFYISPGSLPLPILSNLRDI